jgi:hypothetical protein
MGATRESLSMSVAERREKRIGQQAFWARQAENTLDRGTAMMPKLLYDRLDELGLDFVVVYPTAGLRLPRIQDDAPAAPWSAPTTSCRPITSAVSATG